MARQRTVESISQGIDLASAVATLLKQYVKVPIVGLALGAIAVTALLTMFSNMKAKAFGASQYGEGGWVDGKPHSQGGVNANLEGKEFVIKKRQAAKYPSLIEHINNDTLPTLNQSVLNSTSFEKKGDVIVSTKEWGEIRDLLADNLKGERVVIQGNKKIITSGIKKRIINNV